MSKIKAVRDAVGVLEKKATNPFYKSKYIDINGVLDVLDPELNKQGLEIVQPLTTVGTRPAVRTVIKDGDNVLFDDAIIMPDLQDPQKMGACITYYRRYSLISLFALKAEDDDGNMASGKAKQQNYAEGVPPVPDNKVPF